MSKIFDYLSAHQEDIVHTIERLVKAESPSNDKHLVDECGHVLTGLFETHLSVRPEVIPQSDVGNHMKFTVGNGDQQILIVGHFDTVWDKGRLLYRVENDKIYGPGVFDMKAGIVQAMWAVKAIQATGTHLPHKVVFLCNSDEELGSVTSRALIEQEAKKSKAVFIVEPSEASSGALKTARKGIGMYDLKIHGVSAHAGNHHDRGTSAILELAKQVEFLEGLTDYSVGTTINVGIVSGGTRRNVIPEYAEAIIDLRVSTLAEADRIEKIIHSLAPYATNAIIEVGGGINRPPMERNAAIEKLFAKAEEIAESLGFELTQASVGGGSDGNFTAALGVPTLDGLGAVGDGPHAEYEHVRISTIPERSALVAHLLTEI